MGLHSPAAHGLSWVDGGNVSFPLPPNIVGRWPMRDVGPADSVAWFVTQCARLGVDGRRAAKVAKLHEQGRADRAKRLIDKWVSETRQYESSPQGRRLFGRSRPQLVHPKVIHDAVCSESQRLVGWIMTRFPDDKGLHARLTSALKLPVFATDHRFFPLLSSSQRSWVLTSLLSGEGLSIEPAAGPEEVLVYRTHAQFSAAVSLVGALYEEQRAGRDRDLIASIVEQVALNIPEDVAAALEGADRELGWREQRLAMREAQKALAYSYQERAPMTQGAARRLNVVLITRQYPLMAHRSLAGEAVEALRGGDLVRAASILGTSVDHSSDLCRAMKGLEQGRIGAAQSNLIHFTRRFPPSTDFRWVMLGYEEVDHRLAEALLSQFPSESVGNETRVIAGELWKRIKDRHGEAPGVLPWEIVVSSLQRFGTLRDDGVYVRTKHAEVEVQELVERGQALVPQLLHNYVASRAANPDLIGNPVYTQRALEAVVAFRNRLLKTSGMTSVALEDAVFGIRRTTEVVTLFDNAWIDSGLRDIGRLSHGAVFQHVAYLKATLQNVSARGYPGHVLGWTAERLCAIDLHRPDKSHDELLATLFHEAAHGLEFVHPGLREACVALRAQRETERHYYRAGTRISAAEGEGASEDEVTCIAIGRFLEPAMGIVRSPWTEMLSYAFEYFRNPLAMLRFLGADFEHFCFVVGALDLMQESPLDSAVR